MATRLFLRATKNTGISIFRDLSTTAGTETATNITTRTTSGGTLIQLTDVTDGEALEWVSGRVPAGGFTLSGNVTAIIAAREAANNTNAGLSLRLFKRDTGGGETQIADRIFPSGTATELNTTLQNRTWTAFTPTSTSFAENERLVVRFYTINAGGTMGASATGITGRYDSADGGTGGSYVEINENVSFKLEGDAKPRRVTKII